MKATRGVIALAVAVLAGGGPAAAQDDVDADAASERDRGGRVAVLSYQIDDGVSIGAPLTDAPGDAERGRMVFFDPELGGCASCHWVPGVEAPREALAGPALDDVGARYSSGVVRLWIVNPRALREEPAMPAYYSLELNDERIPGDAPERLGPLLTAQEVEDLVAYLEEIAAPPIAPE